MRVARNQILTLLFPAVALYVCTQDSSQTD